MGKKQVAMGIVIRSGKILLVKRPQEFKWNIPGFKVNGEAPEDTVVNKIKKDTGIEIELKDFIDVLNTENVDVFWYLCSYNGGMIESKSDVQWIDIKNIRDFVSEDALKVYPNEVLRYLGLKLQI